MGINLLTTLAATSRYTYDYDDLYDTVAVSSAAGGVQGAAIWTIISAILAVIGGILLYFLFVKSKKVNPANKFLAWCKTFLRFDTMCIEDILKIVYIVLALFLTLSSFGMIGYSFLGFILTLTLGNLFVRLGFEMSMMFIMIWRNTTDMKKSLSKGDKE